MRSSSNDLSSMIHHNDPLAIRTVSNHLISLLPDKMMPIVILCIGSDRSTGDALGPLTGTVINNMQPKMLHVLGTLKHPVHALNLDETLKKLNNQQNDAFVIAIDASLGHQPSIGHFQYGSGSILPGAALKKHLPAVGDAFITGIVNIAGMMEYTLLQSTRLSTIYDMAHVLAKILYQMDVQIQHYYREQMKRAFPYLTINNEYIL